MKKILYLKFAWNNIIKNKYLYIPNILTGTGLIAVFYILMTLSMDQRLSNVRGGNHLPSIMPMGTVIIGILSFILILYTGSFLMKQRKREFGLYNILGLEKRHVGWILFLESAISSLISIISGLFLGIVLYKLCALLICRILKVKSVLGFYYITPKSLIMTTITFAVFYILNMLLHRIQIAKMRPVELLKSSQSGEKEPKIKWVTLFIGVLCLSVGYYIALTTESPLMTLLMIFLASLLVMLGTYCLFMAGTIALLKFLKKRKNFYYQKSYMVAVSSLLYRMKRNAVGFASITILACGVLVMMSSTISMYAGIEDSLKKNCPHQYSLSVRVLDDNNNLQPLSEEQLMDIAQKAVKRVNLNIGYSNFYKEFCCTFLFRNGEFIIDPILIEQKGADWEAIKEEGAVCTFLTAKDYEKLTGEQVDISENEVLVYQPGGNRQKVKDSFIFAERTFQVKRKLESFPISTDSATNKVVYDFFGIIVSDDAMLNHVCQFQEKEIGAPINETLEFDIENLEDNENIEEYMIEEIGYAETLIGNRNRAESYQYGMLGSLLFLGLILSFIFIFVTALIIYYKQTSEGYEDRQRYQIMQKIGMSGHEVKSTIRSQIRIMFFLPIIVAAIHVSVAMPILLKLLRIILLSEPTLFIGCMAGALIVFILIYVVIYRITARIYYNIVKR